MESNQSRGLLIKAVDHEGKVYVEGHDPYHIAAHFMFLERPFHPRRLFIENVEFRAINAYNMLRSGIDRFHIHEEITEHIEKCVDIYRSFYEGIDNPD